MSTILSRIRRAVLSLILEEPSGIADDAAERERWLDAVHDLATQLAGQEDLDSLIHRAAELAQEHLHSETASVFLMEGDRLCRQAIAGLPDDWLSGESYAPGEGLTGRVVQPPDGEKYGQPIRVNQVDQDPRVCQRHLEAYCHALESGRVRHLIAVPLNGQVGTFGVLRVVNRLDDRGRLSSEGFSSTDVDLLSILGHVVAVAVENARFREEVERRALELEQLQEATRRMTTTLDSEQLLQTIVDIGATVVESDYIGIIEVHDDGSWGNIISNYKADFPEPQTRPRPDGIARQIQRTLEPIVFDKVVDDGPHNPALVKAGVKSYAGVPVIGEGRLRAVIFFHSLKPAAYRGKLPLLLTFANQVATAMRNCELFEQEQAKRLLAERLQAASSIMRSSLNRNEVLERILTEVAAVVPYDTASIQLLQRDRLEIVACRGFPEPDKVLGLTFPMDIQFPNYHVIRRAEWQIIDDVRANHLHFADPRWHATHIRSWLGIPLVYRGDVIGMLSLDHKEPAFYQPGHAKIALAFAAQATVAIETARLFEVVQSRLTKAEILASASSELLAETDLQQLQRKVAASAGRLLWHADGAVLHLLNGLTEKLEPKATWPEHIVKVMGRALMALGEGIAGTVLQERKTVRLDDVSHTPQFLGPPKTPGLSSLLVAPMCVGTKLVGTLSVYSEKVDAFNESDEHLLTALASQAGTALANLEMWQVRDVRRRRVEQMLEGLREFDVGVGLDEVQRLVATAAGEILGYRLAALKMLNRQGDKFIVNAVVAPKDLDGIFDPTGSVISISEMDEMLEQGQAMKHCNGFWVPGALLRYRRDQPATGGVAELIAERSFDKWGTDDALLIPLGSAEGAPIGFLSLAQPESGSPPQHDDQQLIGVFASLATTIIQNARLFQATKSQKERLRAYLSAAGSQLAYHTDIEGLGAFISQAAVSFLDAEDCSLFLVDEEGQTIRYVTSSLPRPREECPPPMPVGTRKGAGLIPYVAATGRPLSFIGDQFTRHDAYSDHLDSQVRWSPSGRSDSLLLVPMHSGDGSTVGVLTVWNKQGVDPDEGFSSFDMEFLEALANQAAADVVRLREFRRLREEASRVERSRLEGELHEAMNTLATGAMWEADVLVEYAHTLPEEATYGLQRLRLAMRRTYEDLKYILWDLRDPVLEEQGLVVALEAYAEMIGRDLVTVVGDRERRIPFEYEHALYRIGQEAISNAIKHSCIKYPEDGIIRVSVEFGPSSAKLSVCDDGIGFDVDSAFQKVMVPSGLIRLRELARSMGIEFEVRSERGKGTEVCAQVQLAATGE